MVARGAVWGVSVERKTARLGVEHVGEDKLGFSPSGLLEGDFWRDRSSW